MPDIRRPVRSIRWGSRLAAGVLLSWLAACAGPGGTTAGGARTADGKDIATASDQTDADRRAKLHMELAGGYYSRGQFTVSLDEVKQSLAAKPDSADAYNLRGLIYAALNDPGTAEESFRHALQLHPGDPDTLHNYGWLLCQQQRWADADAQFVAALAAPNYLGGSRTLLAQGVCQARAGQLPEAERTLSHAFELDPANPVTAVNLTEVLYRRGQYDRARFYIRRVNSKDELASAQTLWIAARIEKKLGNDEGVRMIGVQMHQRFPQAPETQAFDRGSFND